MNVVRDTTLIQNFAVGLFLPLLIAMVNQAHWPAKVKGLVAFVICAVAALVLCWLRGELNLGEWSATGAVVLTAALGFYRVLWQPSTIGPGLERATSLLPVQRTHVP